MTDQTLFDAIDRHGGDPDLWPEALGIRARAAERDDPAFAAALAEARALDAMLMAASAPEPLPPGYATRIVARAAEPAAPRWFRARIALPFAAATAGLAALAGVAAANALATVDPDLLSLAELALGASGLVAGN